MRLPHFALFLSRSALVGLLFAASQLPLRAQDANTIVYVDALWQRVHAADCPELVLKDQKQTMTLGQADQLGYRIGESGQSGRTDCCLQGYTRQYPAAVTASDAMGVAEVRDGDVLKYHVHGCHRFTPDRDDYRMTLGEVLATPGNYHCEHCIERGTGVAQMTQEEWDKLPSHAPWVPPLGWAPSPFSVSAYPEQSEIDILISEALHGGLGIQERTFIDPVATVDNFMIMRFFFPVHRWLELYQAYRVSGNSEVLEQLRGSARNYNALSKNYLSAAQKKARDPEGLAYMYSMAASAKITLQLALKYPEQVTAAEIAEAEDFLMTIMSVLEPTCEGNDNLDPQMGIPQPLADDFRDRAFNRALNGIGTIGMTVAALEDLQVLNSTTAYQATIDRYRKIIREYITNWKNTGFSETVEGLDYFSYPYSATDNGYWVGDVKLFSADDQGHFSHSMQGCYLLFESVPEEGVDEAFMTALANTIHFNALTLTSGSPQTPSQEAIRPYSRYPYGYPGDRMYLLAGFREDLIDAQCVTLNEIGKEAVNSGYDFRLATFNAMYLKELRQDPTLIHLGEDSVAPPAPPTGLVGTGSNGSVSLNWDDNTESDMSSGTYSVYRSTTYGSGYVEIANSLSSSAYVDNAVVNDTMYFYVVTANDTNGDVSAFSAEAPAAPFVSDATPPAIPASLVASGTDGSASLDWADNGESDFNSYTLYRSTSSDAYGAALVTGIIPSEYVDTDVENGTTYYYVLTAVDHSGNESAESVEISATPEAYGPTIRFGSNDDGWGGFSPSGSTGTEVWSLTSDSLNYAFGLPATDEGHTASLLKSYMVDRSVGSSYTIEGVVDLTAGYGDDNNRIGIILFNSTPTQTDDGGGLYLRLNTDGREIAINNGLNGTTLASANATGSYSGDSWIGTTLTFSVDVDFTDVAGTDKIDLSFTFTDQNGNTDTITAQVDAASYTGSYCGFLSKWRQRGDGGSNDAPPVFDYRRFTFSDNAVVDETPPAAPTGLAATIGDEYISLDWADNGEGDLASYNVYRSSVSGSYGGALVTGLFASSYIDDTAVNGNTYYYVVRAVDTSSNVSSSSAEVSGTPADVVGPDAPTNLSATAGHGFVKLDWDDNGEIDLGSYTIYRSENPGTYGTPLISGLSNSGYVDTSAENGTSYYYVVTADDLTGNESAQSSEASATPVAVGGSATSFVGDGVSGALDNFIGTVANWDTGLPVGQEGSITIAAEYDSNVTHSGYQVRHTEGTIRRGNGYAAFRLGTGSVWVMDGSAAAFTATRGITMSDSQFILNDGNADLRDNNRDTELSGSDGIIILNGGSMLVGRTFQISGGGQLTVNGGTLTVGSALNTPSFSSSAGPMQFNGGTTTAAQFNFDKPAVVTFGGTSPGSVTLTTALGNGATQNWLNGTQMSLTAATDEWAATEWDAGRILYNGLSKSDLGKSWAQVTAVNGLETDVRFVYNSSTETLSLEMGGADLTPPASPTGLVSTPGDGSVSLDWNDNGEADIDTYTVFRSETSDDYGAALATGLSASEYIDNTATNGTTYYYVVTAVDTNGNESSNSSEVSATPVDATPPAAPTGLAATPGDGTINLEWNDNGELDVVSYTVYRTTTAGSGYASIASGIGSSAYTDNAATNGTTYYYVVTAVDIASNESDHSSEISATAVDAPPAAPQNLSVLAGDGSVSLDWDGNVEVDLAGYTVYRSTTAGSGYSSIASGVGASAFADNTVVNGTTYYYVVAAVDNGSNESDLSTEVSATPSAQVRFEAEDATLSGVQVANNNAGFSGTGFVDYINPTGDYIEWTITLAEAGDFQLVFGYALGNTDRPLEIRLNGEVLAPSLSFPDTGGWSSWAETAPVSATLQSGVNTIRVIAIGSSGGNVDYLEATRVIDPDADGDGMDDTWEAANFGDLSQGASDDFDGDGLSNLMERAFGTIPSDGGDRVPMPAGEIAAESGKNYLCISYRRLIGGTGTTGVDYTVGGITYRVEYDSDLAEPWNSGSVTQVGEPVDNGDGTETVMVRLNSSVENATSQFIRLRVLPAP